MNTWILVADASRARIFQWNELRDLQRVREFDNPKGRARAQDLVSDESGRLAKGRGRNVMSAMDPRTSPHEAEAEHFARQLAQALHDGLIERQVQAIALIAPPHFLGLLRECLTPDVAKATVLHLPRDYAELSEHNLRGHLDDVLAEIDKVALVR